MSCTTDDLMRKEVINICTAQSLGCIRNFEVDISCGKIIAIIVSAGRGFFSFSSDCDIRVPWDKITRIGEDVILVDFSRDNDKDDRDGKGDKDDRDGKEGKDRCEWCQPRHDPPRKKHGRFF